MPKRARSWLSPLTAPTPTLTQLSGRLAHCACAGPKAANMARAMRVWLKPRHCLDAFIMTRPFSAEHELGSWIGETRVVAAMDIGVAVEATSTLRVVDTALSPRVRTKERWRLTLSHQLRQIPAVRRMAGVA